MKNAIDIIKKHQFKLKKAFGQNFITDEELLSRIVDKSSITSDDTVVEIGPGAGTLTREIAKVAKRVVCYEIDKTLEPVLNEMLEGCHNVEVRYQDIMTVDKSQLSELGEFKVVANLPYYITTPIVMFFLEEVENVSAIVVMVQLEVAKRFCATSGSSDYGAITVSIDLEGSAEIVEVVSRNMFFPPPNVDSAVVKIDIDRNKYDVDKSKVKRLVKSAFKMRRKTLMNNLVADFQMTKEDIALLLEKHNIDTNIRGEKLSTNKFIELTYDIVK